MFYLQPSPVKFLYVTEFLLRRANNPSGEGILTFLRFKASNKLTELVCKSKIVVWFCDCNERGLKVEKT